MKLNVKRLESLYSSEYRSIEICNSILISKISLFDHVICIYNIVRRIKWAKQNEFYFKKYLLL